MLFIVMIIGPATAGAEAASLIDAWADAFAEIALHSLNY